MSPCTTEERLELKQKRIRTVGISRDKSDLTPVKYSFRPTGAGAISKPELERYDSENTLILYYLRIFYRTGNGPRPERERIVNGITVWIGAKILKA
ncbi:hypothetical protein EVAR_93272_1 [Eumeta japonica]|uniref:Uncharacterized protein n=1 Tax=Eumeta variegata TaxID=151549 RepID=A0A4C1TXR7_EUMVA|nr:hypothetical protein EVAR_93272_1 [Eumeta japonica]